MAGEIQAPHPQNVAANTYAIVRNAVGQVYAGITAETYATANLATYAIALAQQGTASHFYVGTFPALPSGVYTLAIYERSGVAPAEGDPCIAFGEILWTGSALLSAAGIASALLDMANGVETGITVRQALRAQAAAAAGKRSNAGTITEQYDAIGNPGTARIAGGLDSSGNGTPGLTL